MEAVGNHPNNSIPVNILEFVVDVICKFSSGLLSAERRIGPGCIQRPPEVQCQDEFYPLLSYFFERFTCNLPWIRNSKGASGLLHSREEWGVERLPMGTNLKTILIDFRKRNRIEQLSLCRTTSSSTAVPRVLRNHTHISVLAPWSLLTDTILPTTRICRNCTMLFSGTISKTYVFWTTCCVRLVVRPVRVQAVGIIIVVCYVPVYLFPRSNCSGM